MTLRVMCLGSGSCTTIDYILKSIKSGDLFGVEVVAVVVNKKDAGIFVRAKESDFPLDRIHYLPLSKYAGEEQEQHMARGEEIAALAEHYDAHLVSQNGWLPKTPTNLITRLSKQQRKLINQHPAPTHPFHPHLSFGGTDMIGLAAHAARWKFCLNTRWRDPTTEATVHEVTGVYDDGHILMTETMVIHPEWTPEMMQTCLLPREQKLVRRFLQSFARGLMQITTRKTPLVLPGEEPIIAAAKEWGIAYARANNDNRQRMLAEARAAA